VANVTQPLMTFDCFRQVLRESSPPSAGERLLADVVATSIIESSQHRLFHCLVPPP
jgi:hypothetical protein